LANTKEGEGYVRQPEEIEQEVAGRLESILDSYERSKAQSKAGPSTIPTFFKPKPKPDSLLAKVKKHARLRKEQIKHEMVLDDGQLRQVWYLLEEYAIHDGDDIKINYDGFSQVATRCRELFGPAMTCLFKASTFMMFEQDGDGCISANQFASYLNSRSSLLQMHTSLTAYADPASATLNVYQVEEYLRSMVPELPPLQDMPEDFEGHYARIAARKFLFFHGRSGETLRVRDLVTSHVLHELHELKSPSALDAQLISNWFSLQSTKRVHHTFQALGGDMRGKLSRSEFSQISSGTMSPLFINRIFEEHVMKLVPMGGRRPRRDEMDLVAFTDFVLAWDHRSHPAAIKYFFPIFDLQQQGRITPADLYTFFKEIHHMWVHELNEYADLAIYDVVDEIIDMVKPRASPTISPEDLAASGMSGVFFSILSDVKQFYDYNYRENLIHQDDDQ